MDLFILCVWYVLACVESVSMCVDTYAHVYGGLKLVSAVSLDPLTL